MKKQRTAAFLRESEISKKILPLAKLIPLVKKLKRQGKRIVTTNGCFDIIHAGHVGNLEWARKQGDVLVVGINSDTSVRALKGPTRPIISERDRALVLAALASVDYVFIFRGLNPLSWIPKVRPDAHVKGRGSTTSPAFINEKKLIERCGGSMRLAPFLKGYSTTDVVATVLHRYHFHKKTAPQLRG